MKYALLKQRKISFGRNRCVCQSNQNSVILWTERVALDWEGTKEKGLRIWLTDTSISANGNFALCRKRVFFCLVLSAVSSFLNPVPLGTACRLANHQLHINYMQWVRITLSIFRTTDPRSGGKNGNYFRKRFSYPIMLLELNWFIPYVCYSFDIMPLCLAQSQLPYLLLNKDKPC